MEFGAGTPTLVSSTLSSAYSQDAEKEKDRIPITVTETNTTESETANQTAALSPKTSPALIWPDIPSSEWKQSRSLSNIGQVVREFSLGCGSVPPIRDLEKQYGSKWRNSASNRKFYSQRNLLYKTILYTSQQKGISVSEAAELWDAKRRELGFSLAVMQPWMFANKDVL